MKKALSVILLTLMLASLLCVGALADGEPTVAGLYDFQSESVSIKAYTAENDTTAISADNGFYANAVRFDVTYSNTALEAGEQCLLLVCSGSSGPPSAENIVYINQKAAESNGERVTVTFDGLDRAYPSKLGKGDYRIYVVSENSAYDLNAPTATFSYHVPYKLGDVNDDTHIDSDDALLVLKHSVHLVTLDPTPQLAADVNKDAHIDSDDALLILKYSVHLITEF